MVWFQGLWCGFRACVVLSGFMVWFQGLWCGLGAYDVVAGLMAGVFNYILLRAKGIENWNGGGP